MDRNRSLLFSTLALGGLTLVYFVWSIWANWGLITIHAKQQPLSAIIRSIEKQGHITLKTNLDPATKVTMHVTKVPLTEALETLAVNTEAGWRLTYVIAPLKTDIRTAVENLLSDKKNEGWKQVGYPMLRMFGNGEPPSDPRLDVWTVTAQDEKKIQAYLKAAARGTNAAFLFPTTWNPQLKSPPCSGRIGKVVPKLASATHASVEELFVLQKWRQRDRSADATDDTAQERPRGGPQNSDVMRQRMQAQIDKLPADQRTAAQAQFDEQRKFFESVRNLPNDERRKQIEDHFNDPKVQDQMQNRNEQGDKRRSPDKKVQRYDAYANRRAAAKQAQGK